MFLFYIIGYTDYSDTKLQLILIFSNTFIYLFVYLILKRKTYDINFLFFILPFTFIDNWMVNIQKVSFYKLESFENENFVLIGFMVFLLTLISLVSNLFFPHNFIHNILMWNRTSFFSFFKSKKEKIIFKIHFFNLLVYSFRVINIKNK